MILIFCFSQEHNYRTTSRTTKESVDEQRIVAIRGPPALPAQACFSEPVGKARAGYGVWVHAHKTIKLATTSKWRRPAGRTDEAAPLPITPWEQTVSRSEVCYSKVSAERGDVEWSTSLGFWRAAMRQLQVAIEKGSAVQVGTGPLPQRSPQRQGVASLQLSLMGGQEVWVIDELDDDFLRWALNLEFS